MRPGVQRPGAEKAGLTAAPASLAVTSTTTITEVTVTSTITSNPVPKTTVLSRPTPVTRARLGAGLPAVSTLAASDGLAVVAGSLVELILRYGAFGVLLAEADGVRVDVRGEVEGRDIEDAEVAADGLGLRDGGASGGGEVAEAEGDEHGDG